MKAKPFKYSFKKIYAASLTLMLGCTMNVYSATIIWNGTTTTPGTTNNLASATNWSTNTIPGTGDTAQFQNNGATTALNPFTTTVTPPLTFGGIIFADTTQFTFSISGAGVALDLEGTGISNNSTSTQIFNVGSAGTMGFFNTSSADTTASGTININATGASSITFNGTSTASNATITAAGASSVIFNGASTGSSSNITANTSSNVTINQENTIGSLVTDATSTVNLNGFQLTVGTTNVGTNTIAGVISGAGGSLVQAGTGTLILTGANTYTGGTTVASGTLQGNSTSLQGNIVDNGALVFNQTTNGTYAGNVSGTGSFSKTGAGLLILSGTNSYTGGTTISTGSLQGNTSSIQGNILDNASLIFNQTTNGTYSGAISGTGTLQKIGSATLILTGSNTYSGGTTISAGAIQGNTNSIQGNFLDNGTLIFDQGSNGSFTGIITGTGIITKQNTGNLNLTANSSAFTGTTNITQGILTVNGALGGTTNVLSGGTLAGIGNLGNVNVNSGGKVSLNNTIGTMNLTGNLVVNSGGGYNVTLGNNPATHLLNVTGTATLNGGTVNLISGSEFLSLETTYPILNTTGGLTGKFQGVVGTTSNIYLTPALVYDAYAAYLTLVTQFAHFADNKNQDGVARQFDSVTTPSGDIKTVIDALLELTPHQLRKALDQMEGQQYTSLIQIAQASNHRFIRQLYDPLRVNIANLDQYPAHCQNTETWFDVQAGTSTLHGNKNAQGYTSYDAGVSAGIQQTLSRFWTIGAAGNYEYTSLNYKLNGSGNINTAQAALYGAYHRPQYYFLADFLYGFNGGKVRRKIHFNDIHRSARSNPSVYEFVGYGETGLNFLWLCTLIQPFFGVESGNYTLNHFKENGAESIDLSVHRKSVTSLTTSLGLHLAKDLSSKYSISTDFAWLHRHLSLGNHLKNKFKDFGSEFSIDGVSQRRNSFEATLYGVKTLSDKWSAYTEFTGEIGSHYSSIWLTVGLDARW